MDDGPRFAGTQERLPSTTSTLKTTATVPPAVQFGVSEYAGKEIYVDWGCEETKSGQDRYPVSPSEFFVSATWEVLEIVGAKSYSLPPPTFDPAARIVEGRYSFTGLDRVWLNCPGGGHARIRLRFQTRQWPPS